MAHATPRRLTRQAQQACRALARTDGLPFAQHLPAAQVRDACRALGCRFRDRIFSPAVTLWTFLAQCLDADPSCRQAVARLLAWRAAAGLPRCATNTGAYCKARCRLPEALLARLARDTGAAALQRAAAPWRWLGRVVKVADGTCLSMPDTAANQKAYPQPRSQKPGCGFPLLRLVVVFSLAVGTVLDAALGGGHGPGTGEQSLFRALWDGFAPGDVLLGDRNFCSYWVVAGARARGADVVLRLNAGWAKGLKACQRLAPGERRVRLTKPARPPWMAKEDYAAAPAELWVRCVEVRVRQKGFRTQSLAVATTLWDRAGVTAADLAALYRCRWQAELYLRSLKESLQLDILRGRAPEVVRKEVWAHLLVYNVIRGLMAQAALARGLRPEAVSFTGAAQATRAFLPHLRTAADAAAAARLAAALLQAISEHRVHDRPDRCEPRATKRRPKNYPYLTVPRAQSRARLAATT
jgi:hypothetical protein